MNTSKTVLDAEARSFKQFWGLLSNIPTNENDEIEEPFLTFPAGTHREVIWHYLEDFFKISIGEWMTKRKIVTLRKP